MRLPRILATLALLSAAAGALVWNDARTMLTQALPITQKQRVDVPAGSSLSATLAQLRMRGILPSPRLVFYLRVHARLSGQSAAIKAGEYELSPGMSSLDLLALIVSGKTVLHELRLIEGWTFAQALAVIQASDELVHTLKDADTAKIMAAIGRAGVHPEGRLFADTYRFPKGTTDEAFLRRAMAAMDSALKQEWESRQTDLPYHSPEEALIMASIVEKETGAPEERPQIAAVFLRRLALGMKLQTDPTVIYGLGASYDGNLHRRDLETDTPYNTYTRPGLPPTPICLPGRAAIHAALHPAAGSKALYFVARGNGTHQFSETLEQHNVAVREFQLRKRK